MIATAIATTIWNLGCRPQALILSNPSTLHDCNWNWRIKLRAFVIKSICLMNVNKSSFVARTSKVPVHLLIFLSYCCVKFSLTFVPSHSPSLGENERNWVYPWYIMPWYHCSNIFRISVEYIVKWISHAIEERFQRWLRARGNGLLGNHVSLMGRESQI